MYNWSKGTLTDDDQRGQFEVIEDASVIEKSAYVAYILDAKTEKDTYYALAMKLMHNMYKFTSAGDALEINWTTFPLLSAAEILRLNPAESGFTITEQANLNTLITKAPKGTERYPMGTAVNNESPYGGNWLFTSFQTRMALAIYTNNRTQFANAYLETSQKLSSNIYLKSDGQYPVPSNPDPKYAQLKNWMGATADDLYDGFHGEACRDLNHALRIGTKRIFSIAQMASLQNNANNEYDFLKQNERRITAFMELFAGWMTTVPIPNTMCGGTGQFGQTVEGQFNCNGDLKGIAKGSTPCAEKVFYGYTYPDLKYRLNHDLPYTKAMHAADNAYRIKQGDLELMLYREPKINVKQGTMNYTNGGNAYVFPATSLNSKSASVTFSIENLGNFQFEIQSVKIEGINKDEFTITTLAPSIISGPSAEKLTFIVEFVPKKAGTKSAFISIANNNSEDNVYKINLLSTRLITGFEYEEELKANRIVVHPNPSNDGIFNLSQTVNWKVYSILGKELKSGNSNTINLSDYPKGVYLVKVNDRVERVVID